MKNNTILSHLKNKMVVSIIISFFLISMGVNSCISTESVSFGASGKATATVLNSPPTITNISISDAGSYVEVISLEKEYEYTINIKDPNTLMDIRNAIIANNRALTTNPAKSILIMGVLPPTLARL